MLVATLCVLFATYLAVFLHKRYKTVRTLSNIPGPPSLPLLGNVLDIAGTHSDLFAGFLKFCTYGSSGIVKFYLGLQPYIFLFRANTVEKLLSSNEILDKSTDYTFMEPWLKTGLLTSTGSKWRSRRKLLTPTFHFKILEEYLEVFNNKSKILVEKLQEKEEGKEEDIFPEITLCTLDIILEAAMGNYSNLQRDQDSDYVKAVLGISDLIVTRSAKPWLSFDFIFKVSGYKAQQDKYLEVLHGSSMSAIRNRRLEYAQIKQEEQPQEAETLGKKKRLAFLDLLIEQSSVSGLSDEDIQEEVDTFMFEGHDTTATGISFALYCLARSPLIQERAYEEVMSVVGEDENMTMNHLREMKYLESCIKEALRLYPSVPFTGRKLREEMVIDNFRIPAGTNVFVHHYTLHRDEKEFPDPENFNPERFMDSEVNSKRHPYSYCPFSAGPRNCIGQKFAMMEEKVVIAHVLRTFKITSSVPPEKHSMRGDLVLRPAGGVPIALQRRIS